MGNTHVTVNAEKKKKAMKGPAANPVVGDHPSPPVVDRPVISASHKEIIIRTWSILQADIAKVGVVMFIGLFESHPDVKLLFVPFRNLSPDDMKHNAVVRAHALRVMGTVEKVVARLDEPEKLVDVLHQLGRRHSTYNAKPEYVDLIGPQFVQAICPALEDHWAPDVEDAWLNLFKFVTHVMKEDMMT